jgi:ferredoxin--NADP+ reductase
VTVGGKIRFACVDGPEFDGHAVDFRELSERQGTYRELECRLDAQAAALAKEGPG